MGRAGPRRHAARRAASRGRLRDFLAQRRTTSRGADCSRRALDYARRRAALRRRRVRARAGRRDRRRQLPRARPHAGARRAIVHALPRQDDVRRPAAAGQVRPVRGRGRHGGHVLRVQQPDGERLLHRGDTIALGTPIFTPYLEIPQLDEFQLQDRRASSRARWRDGRHTWQYPDAELDKLADPERQGVLPRQPQQPGLVRHPPRDASSARRAGAQQAARPASSSPTTSTARSSPASARWPPSCRTTPSCVYSYSKYFGCTGWRLGVSRCTRTTSSIELIARLPPRPSASALRPALPFAHHRARRAASSSTAWWPTAATVALNHTAGLSLPQQVQMTLFSLFALLDETTSYKQRCRAICASAARSCSKGLGMPAPPTTRCAPATTPTWIWRRGASTRSATSSWTTSPQHHDPLDIVLALAQAPRHGAAQRQRLQRAAVVGARVARQPGRRGLRRRSAATCARSRRAAVAQWRRSAGGGRRDNDGGTTEVVDAVDSHW